MNPRHLRSLEGCLDNWDASERTIAQERDGSSFVTTDQQGWSEGALQLREQQTHARNWAALSELLATVAYEVNQPLCAIVTNGQAVRRMLGNEPVDLADVREAVQDIVADGQRASAVLARIGGLLQHRTAKRAFIAERKPHLSLNEAIDAIRGQLIAADCWSTMLVQIAKQDALEGAMSDIILDVIERFLNGLYEEALKAMWEETDMGMQSAYRAEEIPLDEARQDLSMELLDEVTGLAWEEGKRKLQ